MHRSSPAPRDLDWLGPIGWGTLVLLCAVGGDTLRVLLRYERSAIEAGEYWRLVTGHLVHLGWSHTVLNLAGLAVLWLILRPHLGPGSWAGVGLVSMLSIDLGLYRLYPDIPWYVGFSGVLHGFWAAGTVQAWTAERRVAVALALLLAAKIGWEVIVGPAPWSTGMTGGRVVYEAHWFGALGGLCVGLGVAAVHRLTGRSV